MIYRNWDEITAKNESHFQALVLLLKTAFNRSVIILEHQPDQNTLVTAPMYRNERKALEKVGYGVSSRTVDIPKY